MYVSRINVTQRHKHTCPSICLYVPAVCKLLRLILMVTTSDNVYACFDLCMLGFRARGIDADLTHPRTRLDLVFGIAPSIPTTTAVAMNLIGLSADTHVATYRSCDCSTDGFRLQIP